MATSQRDLLLHCCECLIFVLPTIMGHQKDLHTIYEEVRVFVHQILSE